MLKLSPEVDPMGAAIKAFHTKRKVERLRVLSSLFDEDEIPVSHLFRGIEEMPLLEQKALHIAKGRILDIGAGAGCHSLALQKMGKEVEAIDISELAVEVMQERGVKHVRVADLLDEQWSGQYDTLLLLMNGTGLAGRLRQLDNFLLRLKSLLAPQGQILLDSSDLRFIFENEEGNIDLAEGQDYYGEVDFQMKYGKIIGRPFHWLYLDFPTLQAAAARINLCAELIEENEEHAYLARLTHQL